LGGGVRDLEFRGASKCRLDYWASKEGGIARRVVSFMEYINRKVVSFV